ncbi:hypothetical protein yc1106_08696 [Curvularia clavata]|uniref:Uncharacterized protein n=1 Tax=Curvularia clavata TaxID=95742 RepID=A0A9Q8ZG94_CURCL|nr:hypothetical protein yc1106_08696 [Curvularia clavata]
MGKKSGKKRGFCKPRGPKPKRLALAAEREAAAREQTDAAASAESLAMALSKPVARRAEADEEEEPDLSADEEYEYRGDGGGGDDVDDASDREYQDGVSEPGAREPTPTLLSPEEVEEGSGSPALPRSSSPTRAQSGEVDNLPSVPTPTRTAHGRVLNCDLPAALQQTNQGEPCTSLDDPAAPKEVSSLSSSAGRST